jgi:hypothetical protein
MAAPARAIAPRRPFIYVLFPLRVVIVLAKGPNISRHEC